MMKYVELQKSFQIRGDVVRNPLDEVRGILVLDVEHLLVNLLRRHPAAEETRRRQVAAMTSA